MVEKMATPIDVVWYLKGFQMKACHGNVMHNVAITFALHCGQERLAYLALLEKMEAVMRFGPPPPTPLERRLQAALARLIGSKKGKGKGKGGGKSGGKKKGKKAE